MAKSNKAHVRPSTKSTASKSTRRPKASIPPSTKRSTSKRQPYCPEQKPADRPQEEWAHLFGELYKLSQWLGEEGRDENPYMGTIARSLTAVWVAGLRARDEVAFILLLRNWIEGHAAATTREFLTNTVSPDVLGALRNTERSTGFRWTSVTAKGGAS